MIATVDKFAALPWTEDCVALFACDGSADPPPELIVQDELHLISGPLGTLAGLYETAVDALCTRDGRRPKVVASTATIRRAAGQALGLFDRKVEQFPPPGLDAADSYFAVEAPRDEKASRLYVGLMAPGASHTTLMIRTYAALLQRCFELGSDDEVRDTFWTLLGYFNSLRVLGGARLQLHDDVEDRINVIAAAGRDKRTLREIELTSRVPSGDIPAHLKQMRVAYPDPNALDVILATNMVSVGMDVDRLGLMVVMGQPQLTAEYIQATSRVGRKHPGLVVTLFNSARSRDRSHYESFVAYHSALYRQVESTSVTPFSPRARDRALHAVVVALIRGRIPGLRANHDAVHIGDFDAEVKAITEEVVARVYSVDKAEAEAARRQIDEFLERWRRRASETPNLCYRDFDDASRALLVSAASGRGKRGGRRHDVEPTRRRQVLESLPRDGVSAVPYASKKSAKVRGSVRRSQLITTYGVGALVALESESFVVKGIDWWDVEGPDVHEPRLERQLGVSGFVAPPASENGNDVPVSRFPRFYYCPECRTLDEHGQLTDTYGKKCQVCSTPLVPSRFIVACPNGHLEDFPYRRWVHRGSGGAGHRLTIRAGGATASLGDIVITCETCRVTRTMEGAFARDALKGIIRCGGKRPWLGRDDGEENCDEVPRVVQRGASNIWFPVVGSSLSIPPWSAGAFRMLDRMWTLLKAVPDDALEATIANTGLADRGPYSVADLVAAVRLRREGESEQQEITLETLRYEEYEALLRGASEQSGDDQFVCADVGGLPERVRPWFSRASAVSRLREVRALCAFTRVQPPSPAERSRWAALSAESVGWLPGMEVLGEGIFLVLDEGALQQWESDARVIARCAVIDSSHRKRFATLGLQPDRTIEPRFVLLHTLAHMLISQLSLECGYPAASLRERIYASERMAGLLVYTAAADSAGSLGGLIAQADPERLASSLQEAIARAAWCSADPLCMESEASGVDSLNLAACHACCLLPETSCEELNVFLDRGLLIGTQTDAALGFFAGLVGAL